MNNEPETNISSDTDDTEGNRIKYIRVEPAVEGDDTEGNRIKYIRVEPAVEGDDTEGHLSRHG